MMSNLRQKYTNEEWSEIEEQIQLDAELGKPVSPFVNISVDKLNVEELQALKVNLIKLGVEEYQTWSIDKWITYRKNYEKRFPNEETTK